MQAPELILKDKDCDVTTGFVELNISSYEDGEYFYISIHNKVDMDEKEHILSDITLRVKDIPYIIAHLKTIYEVDKKQ